MHSIYLPWLEDLQKIYKAQSIYSLNFQVFIRKFSTINFKIDYIDLTEFDESKLCEISNLINTKPFFDRYS
jgi:hypothetical protein